MFNWFKSNFYVKAYNARKLRKQEKLRAAKEIFENNIKVVEEKILNTLPVSIELDNLHDSERLLVSRLYERYFKRQGFKVFIYTDSRNNPYSIEINL